MLWNRKDLLTLEELSVQEINLILDTAKNFKEIISRSIKKVPTLRGKTVVNLFFESSTRTRISFELAAKRLSADVINIAIETSSKTKGESLKDMVKNIEAMNVNMIIIRHQCSGVPYILAKQLKCSVINAGDGSHEHPTQGLLDLYTIREKKGNIDGLKIAIVGDIACSRVARSNIWGLLKLGAKITLVGPSNLVPTAFKKLGVEISYNLDEVLPEVDVINVLRLQLERQTKGFIPSLREYSHLFGITSKRLEIAKKDVLIMHPGPINRDVEISGEVADSASSVILEQVTNGIAIRMAILYLLSEIGVKEERNEKDN
ncbi:MAG: aspartate carbamoyltransferase catalytic subunit [bacterium]